MANYLITGIAGFIGSNIAHDLLRRGHSVRGIDDFSSGRPANLSGIDRDIDLRQASILDEAALASACRGIDFVLHQAGVPSVPRSIANPQASHEVNATGTLNVLTAARDAEVRRVVYASSSSVYGDTEVLPKVEELAPSPISPYAVAKLCGEYYTRSFARVYGMETVALRYFNIFGPRQDPGSQYSALFATFIPAMLHGESPTIYGDGEQSRDFTFVANVVHANLLACEAPAEKVSGQAFNIACGQRVSVNEAFRVLRELTASSGEPRYAPPRAGDVKHSYADISRAQAALGYSVQVPFQEGLRETVKWFRSEMRTAVEA